MSVRAGSDAGEGGVSVGHKPISRRDLKTLLAINGVESVILNAMPQKMTDPSCPFNVHEFVQLFRTHTTDFVEILNPTNDSDDSDEDDELVPKVIPYLKAFAELSDQFKDAIKAKYREIYKKDMKELYFAVFKSHPEEIFKSYEEKVVPAVQSPPHTQDIVHTDRNNQETVSSTGLSAEINRMDVNDVSVDTEHGSLLSAPDDEVQKCTLGNESDTPTPTFENWQGVREEKSMERINDMNKTPTSLTSIDSVPQPSVLSESGNPEYGGQNADSTIEDNIREDNSLNHNQSSHSSSTLMPSINAQVDTRALSTTHESSRLDSSSQLSGLCASRELSSVIKVPQSSKFEDESNKENSGRENHEGRSPSEATNVEEQVAQYMNEVMDTIREVHQDLRFALPPMLQRAARAYLIGKRPLPLREFIGEEYMDDKLADFVKTMMAKDASLMQILTSELTDQGETVIHLRHFRHCEDESALGYFEHLDFYKSAAIPQFIENAQHDVSMPSNGVFTVVLSRISPEVDKQLEQLRNLSTDHLNLSTSHSLEKGKPVLLKSDDNTYCRGKVEEEWRKGANGQNNPVKCLLIDYGGVQDIPIEVIYAYPKWTEYVLPAIVQNTTLNAYPVTATHKSDKFPDADWAAIELILYTWKNYRLDIVITTCDDGTFTIDMKNGNGESFTDELVSKGLAKKELPSGCALSDVSSIPTPPPEIVNETLSTTFNEDEKNCIVQGQGEVVDKNYESDQPSNAEHELFINGDSRSDNVVVGGWENIVKSNQSNPSIPASMSVINGSSMTAPSALIMKGTEPEKRGFLEVPSTTNAVPSLFRIVQEQEQPVPTPQPHVLELPIRKPLVQVLDE